MSDMEILVGLALGVVASTLVVVGIEPFHTAEAFTLPRRTPGATLVNNPPPPDDAPPHVTIRVQSWFRRVADVIWSWLGDRILGRDEDFRSWWATTSDADRRRLHHGRHRRDEALRRSGWRSRWAAYDTQAWPTLSTTSRWQEMTYHATAPAH